MGSFKGIFKTKRGKKTTHFACLNACLSVSFIVAFNRSSGDTLWSTEQVRGFAVQLSPFRLATNRLGCCHKSECDLCSQLLV